MPRRMRKAELLRPEPSSAIAFPQAGASAMLYHLIEQKVAKILAARDSFLLESDLREKLVAQQIRRLQTIPQQKKWPRYYERFGCRECYQKTRPHGSTGYCAPCWAKITNRLKEVVAELEKECGVADYRHEIEALTWRATTAERFLGTRRG